MKVNLVPDDAGKVPPTPRKVFGPVGKLPAFQRGLVLTCVQTHAPLSRDNPVCRNTERDFLHQQAVSLEKMIGLWILPPSKFLMILSYQEEIHTNT